MNILKTIFILFLVLSISLLFYVNLEYNDIVISKSGSTDSLSNNKIINLDNVEIVSLTSILTSITSLFGLFVTFFFGWKKEKRDKMNHVLALQAKELEIEKLRKEVSR